MADLEQNAVLIKGCPPQEGRGTEKCLRPTARKLFLPQKEGAGVFLFTVRKEIVLRSPLGRGKLKTKSGHRRVERAYRPWVPFPEP